MFENVELVQQILSPLFQRVQFIATCRKRDVYSKTFKNITSPIFDKLKVLTHTATHIINLSLSHRVESFIPECCQLLAWMSSQVRYLLPELATEIDGAYAAIFQLLPSGYSLQLEIIEFRHCVGKNGYQHSKAWNNFITAVKACKVSYWLKDAVRRRFKNVISGRVGSLFGSMSSLLALIPQPLLPRGEGEQDFKVPLPVREGFRVRAVRSLAKVTYSRLFFSSPVLEVSFDS